LSRKLFRTLIRTVLSQATADRNTNRAFRSLSEKFSITPKALANADMEEIKEAIRVAGLYTNKARVIKNLSHMLLEQFDGSLEFIYSLPLEEARSKLMSLPGVGPKTADVVLLFCAGRPVIPVDTHVKRVSGRLGLTPQRSNPQEYLPVHLLLISLGRKYCKARKPLCNQCPVNTLCPSSQISD